MAQDDSSSNGDVAQDATQTWLNACLKGATVGISDEAAVIKQTVARVNGEMMFLVLTDLQASSTRRLALQASAKAAYPQIFGADPDLEVCVVTRKAEVGQAYADLADTEVHSLRKPLIITVEVSRRA